MSGYPGYKFILRNVCWWSLYCLWFYQCANSCELRICM